MVRNQLDSVSHGESPRSGFRPTEKVVPVPGWSTGPRPCVASAHGGRRGGCAGRHDSGPPPASVGSDSPGREPAGHLISPAGRFGIPQRADRVAANRRLNDPAESATRNVRVPPETEASDRPVKPGGRRSRPSSPRPGKPATRRRAAVRRETEAQVTECQHGGIVAMNVGEMQRLLSLKAEKSPGHRFDDLHGLICDMDWLWLAHDYVAQNAGSKTAGCDGVVMADFDRDAGGNLRRLREALRSGEFEACPVRRVYIPKANGKRRPLGIPSIRDRIVQEAVRMALEPIFEADFSQHSFGFRPNRRTMDAIRHLMCFTKEHTKYFWAIEGDISAYFDTIPHRELMKLVGRRVKDARLLDLIWKFLRAGVMERKLFKGTELGTPQGGIVSPLLANVYLHELDRFVERYTGLSKREKAERRRRGQANFAYARYADDFVVLCNGTREQAMALREELQTFLSDSLRLTLSMEKTKVTHLDEGFEFLGFRLQRSLGGKGMVTK